MDIILFIKKLFILRYIKSSIDNFFVLWILLLLILLLLILVLIIYIFGFIGVVFDFSNKLICVKKLIDLLY